MPQTLVITPSVRWSLPMGACSECRAVRGLHVSGLVQAPGELDVTHQTQCLDVVFT